MHFNGRRAEHGIPQVLYGLSLLHAVQDMLIDMGVNEDDIRIEISVATKTGSYHSGNGKTPRRSTDTIACRKTVELI
jgi:hypothetical protein